MRSLLIEVDQEPAPSPRSGLIRSGRDAILVNSDCLAQRLNLAGRNSVNHNFSRNGFSVDDRADVIGELMRRCPAIITENQHWTRRLLPEAFRQPAQSPAGEIEFNFEDVPDGTDDQWEE
jgi:hypothetical protein